LLERWRSSPSADERLALEPMIRTSAEALDLAPARVPAVAPTTDGVARSWTPVIVSDEAWDIAPLSTRLYELECELIPNGLHVLGQAMSAETRAQMIAAGADADLPAANHELDALVHALDAGFVRPAPGGDVLRNPKVLPTGRNIHGFDPFRIPGAFAMAEGGRQAEHLITRHTATAAFPETLAMVLWGTDNLKSEGTQIAQVLSLIGRRPRFDGYGRLAGAELVPLEELGRPRST
jgi:magnesium chelatase subunit H